MKNRRNIAVLIAALFLVAGCTFETLIGAGGYALYKQRFAPDDVNLTAKNYAAADYLTQQIKTYIDEDDIIRATPLTSTEAPELTSELARRISAQVGTRLSQLGYPVDLSRVAHDVDASLQNESKKNKSPDYIIAGTYYRAKNNLEISLRIVQMRSKNVIGSFEYNVPYSREIKTLAQPEPQIFIVEE